MARLAIMGFEIDPINGGTRNPDPIASGTTVATKDTTVFRSGLASGKCNSGAGNASSYFAVSGSVGAPATTIIRVYFNFTNLPGATVACLQVDNGTPGTGASKGVGARITTGGKLQLWNFVTNAQIGSDSAATIAAGSTWYRVELSVTRDGAGAITACELQLDGTSVASTTGASITAGSSCQAGWLAAPGASLTCNLDDIAINDTSGATNNTWPGDGKIVLLLPISDNSVGASWTDDAGSGTNIFDAVANTPPNGIADTSASTGLHQIRNAGANTSYDANLTTYATAGVGASDTINAVRVYCNVGAPVVTGGKSGSIGVSSNPVIANTAFVGGTSTTTFFWRGAAPGTYPSNWTGGWEAGTLTEAPTVTVGSSPVARLTITGGTTSRIAMCDFIGMYVDYTPAAAATNVFDRQQGSLHTDPFALQVISFAGQRSNVY